MQLYITGGHLTPALAVIDEIQKKHEDISIVFMGREFTRTRPLQRSQERSEIEKRELPFVAIDAAKFHRVGIVRNLHECIKFPLSLFQVARVMYKRKPDVVLSFGGYVALPVCIVGKLFGARIITHEQTKAAGLANLMLARIADTIAVTSPESLAFFPKEKTVVTGNPIRASLFREYKVPPSWFIVSDRPIVYVTGGSQGSQVINNTIARILPKLMRKYTLVHQCGASPGQQYLAELLSEREKLPQELQQYYFVREWIDAREVSYFLRNAKFVVSRAGANTVEELTLAGTPAIFIPLAFAYNDEQYKNIVPLIQTKASLCIMQKDLVPETLWQAVLTMDRQYETIKRNMRKHSQDLITDATKRLIALIKKV